MKTRRTKIILTVGVVAIAFTYGVVNYMYTTKDQQPQPSSPTGIGDSIIPGPVTSYVADYGSPRVLLGYAQEVFAGKVIREIGRDPAVLSEDTQLPHFQYEVGVIYNIKGSASSKIMVDFDAIEGGRLIPGTTYLLAARYWGETHPWHYVGPLGAFYTMVSDDTGLTNEQLLELVLKHERTYELLNAYPNEILRDIDIQKNRVVHSFQSLSSEEKQVVYAKFEELIPPRPVPTRLPQPSEQETQYVYCHDEIDNDGDGFIDFDDSECASFFTEDDWGDCRDGVDNDNDELIDKADPDCSPVLREDLPSLCRDEDDNDLDGLTDAADPDCAEFYPAPPPPAPAFVPPPAPTSTAPEPEPEPTPAPTSSATSTY